MNICLISTVGYPTRNPQAGGVPICVRNLAYALCEEGHKAIIITLKMKGDPYKENDGPVVLYSAPVTFLHYYFDKLVNRAGMWPQIIKIFEVGMAIRKTILKIIKDEDIDIVQYPNVWSEGIFHPKQIKMSVRMDTPLCRVRSIPGVGEESGWGLYEKIERSIVKKAALISCHTQIVAETVIRHYPVDREKVIVIPNLIDTETFKPLGRFQRKTFRIFHPGPRLGDCQKGTSILLKAMESVLKKFPETELILAGKGEIDFSSYSDKIYRCIKNLGWLTSESLAREYSDADICVAPSINWETFSNICAESLACGTPVIASNVGGMPDVVWHGETGLIFPQNDVQALAKAIESLLADSALRLEMGRKGRIEAEKKYNYREVAKQTITAFKRVI